MKEISEKIKKYLEWLHKQNNVIKVGLAGFLSAIIFVFIYFFAIKDSNENSVGYWNFIILIVSSPVAFVIWHFRDENSRQQIENQRKDINLKEFQKLSEWVSGAHLPEIKIVEKSITKISFKTDNESDASPEKKITEQTEERTEEYGQKSDIAHSNIFGKQDGAIALQISAIYNLLPFFRGDYGESFRLPAFNLLKSAWQAMQQDELNELNKLRLQERENAFSVKKGRDISIKQEKDIPISKIKKEIISNLRKKARSPMGVALTHVLLSPNRENTQLNLQDFPEMRSNLCLAGMDFSFKYQKINSFRIFNLSRVNLCGADLSRTDLSGADLSGANLSCVNLSRANLSGANLSGADLSRADLSHANLSGADSSHANLSDANLSNADLSCANLSGADLSRTNLFNANLSVANLYMAILLNANLYNTDLRYCSSLPNKLLGNRNLIDAKITRFNFYKKIYPYWKHPNDPEWGNLTEPEQKEAMQTFCNETGMIIFDDDGNEVAKSES